MSVCSVPFLIFCGLLGLAVRATPVRLSRQLLISAANLAFLASVLPNKKAAALLGFFVAGTYAALWLVKVRSSRLLVPATVMVVIAVFLYLKRYSFLEFLLPQRAWLGLPEVLGISYMLFKFIHMVIDQSQGQLARFTPFSYANYQLSFFTILAGPIQRYNDFHDYWDQPTLPAQESREILAHWNRLLTGMIKLGLFAPLAWTIFTDNRASLLATADLDLLRHFVSFYYAYPVYMFFNFSGYTDIVIGAAGLVGWTLPENFNQPYLSRNVIDYWSRWHISLTHWIRDYVFMTLYKKGAERMPGSQKWLGYGLLFFSLFLSGVWHGSTAGFAVFGAIHGLGAATNQVYTDILRARLGRDRFKAYQKNELIRFVAVVLTLHFVGFAFIFFGSSLGDALAILAKVGRNVFAATTWIRPEAISSIGVLWPVLVVALIGVFVWKGRTWLGSLFERSRTPEGSRWGLVLAKSALITFVLITLWALEKEPEIAYVRF